MGTDTQPELSPIGVLATSEKSPLQPGDRPAASQDSPGVTEPVPPEGALDDLLQALDSEDSAMLWNLFGAC